MENFRMSAIGYEKWETGCGAWDTEHDIGRRSLMSVGGETPPTKVTPKSPAGCRKYTLISYVNFMQDF